MTLLRSQFGEFFAALHNGHQPFAWQERLLTRVIDDRWPDAVVAPTGAGKTSAIDVHVFALALAAASGSPLPPRRLSMVVGRRVLVDDQFRHARYVAETLRTAQGGVLGEVAHLLWTIQGVEADAERSPLLVARLRGGEPPSRRWADHPTAPAVICATPDMWGSRLLFHGYGSSSRAWPRETGLLAFDTVAVVDEAHLARQLLYTARRVGELAVVAEHKWDGPSPLHVVETTATPSGDAIRAVGVEETDLVPGSTLHDRLRRPKPVTLVPCRDWTAGKPRSTVDEMVRQAVALLDRAGDQCPRTVGCFVNTVPRAAALAESLRDGKIAGRDLTVVMLCGQTRPIDIRRLEDHYEGLFTPEGNNDVDVIVSTQTLEVGVDIDLAGIVTELAAGSAIAQRAGRVNRRGRRADGPIVVTIPAEPVRSNVHSGPYGADELNEALAWVRERGADPDGLAPWALRHGGAPPMGVLKRRFLQRPELGDAWRWARTADDLVAEHDPELWLTDDIAEDGSVGLVVRATLPVDADEASALVRLLPPRRHETFSVPIRTARGALTEARAEAPVGGATFVAVRVRGDETTGMEWQEAAEGRITPRVRPGDVIVVDAATSMFTAPGADDRPTPQVVVPDSETRRHTAQDALESVSGPVRPGDVVHRLELAGEDVQRLVHDLRLREPDDPDDLDERAVMVAWLTERGAGDMATEAANLLRIRGLEHKADVIVQRDQEGNALRVLVIDQRRAAADEYVRQEWTPGGGNVLLDHHQRDVSDRVEHLADNIGLQPDLARALTVAAAHHDDGKADPRFQTRLGADAEPLPLAKTRGAPSPDSVRRRQERSALPSGWRHEQRSVVEAWSTIGSDLDRDLVARLIGTTHGHGRAGFPHTAAELLVADDSADRRALATFLFDEGSWDALIERTDRRYGPWTCAYLEAILRAADGQVSGEGR